MAVLNSTILEKVWLEGSNDFQQRIPDPTQADYASVVDALFAPYNNDLFNQFSGLLNGLMGTFIESKTFYNPLKSLKKPAARFGNSERHVAVRYLKAHSYKADDETLLKLEKPEYREWFYSVTNPRRYEFSWSRYELQRVFASDGYGFDDLLAATISQMISSDEYDEMQLMIQGFAEADYRWDDTNHTALFRYGISAYPSTEAAGRELLAAIRHMAGRMKFPSVLYNHIDVPVYESGDTLVLWVTPDVMAYLDVNALATVFQLDKADIKYRIIEIPEFPIQGVYAALTSEDFIYCRDVQYGIEPPFYNPANMTYKYYLHHAQIIGVNPCANCVLFGDFESTGVTQVDLTPDMLIVDTDHAIAVSGYYTPVPMTFVGKDDDGIVTGADYPFAYKPWSCNWEIVGLYDSDDAPIPINSNTFINGQWLHIQKTGVTSGCKIKLYVTPIYVNPSSATTPLTILAGGGAINDGIITLDITDINDLWNNPENLLNECYVERYPYIMYSGTNFEDMGYSPDVNLDPMNSASV